MSPRADRDRDTHPRPACLSTPSSFVQIPKNQEGPCMWKCEEEEEKEEEKKEENQEEEEEKKEEEEEGWGSAHSFVKTQFCPLPHRSEWMKMGQAGAARPSSGASGQKAEPRKNTWRLCVAVTLQEKSL
ncbi:hypothetical protein llap_13431 [Limosa lapponica baueri]|uniref:Uncharacterized protein n=1 Tax=Limosa lapponica baueri TaxID=1758121 RepID=A0A2I0TR52_LIMLA|nr:hypothetical protein llap_13431 [Limosa lapponica baueri]